MRTKDFVVNTALLVHQSFFSLLSPGATGREQLMCVQHRLKAHKQIPDPLSSKDRLRFKCLSSNGDLFDINNVRLG